MRLLLALTFCILCSLAKSQRKPNFTPGRSTIVHLFEWKWTDIANECEGFLKEKGYGGVQVSPPNENLIIGDRPWWERYQPVSYQLVTRSGNREEFANMLKKCNTAGIRVYADVVFSHMTAMDGTGTAGNSASKTNYNYPGVPYTRENFHYPPCDINNYKDRDNTQKCELNHLADLDQSQEYVRGKIQDYLNDLISLGVAGFRVDAAKQMPATDLKIIFNRLNNLNTSFGFEENSRAFIYQEVIDFGGDAVDRSEYTAFACITEFRNGAFLGQVFQGLNNQKLQYLKNWGTEWSLVNSEDAVVFIDNHDTQRGGDVAILNYKKSKPYKMAIAFMQTHPYGITRVLSGYYFETFNQGPPIVGPSFNADNTCTNGWSCEHRWREVFSLVQFRNTVEGTGIENWWDNGDQQIAFSRGDKGFIAFTNKGDIDTDIKTDLPAGTYCDVISADLINGKCTGRTVTVANGFVRVNLKVDDFDGMLAIHVNAKSF